MEWEHKTWGVVGGGGGLGRWMADFLRGRGLHVRTSDPVGVADYRDNVALARVADVVVVAAPIAHLTAVLAELLPHLNGKVLVDISSVKEFVVEQVTHAGAAAHFHYFSVHPMFAPTLRSLRGQTLLWNHTHRPLPDFEVFFRDLFAAEGARWHQVDYRTHDRLMGIVQGLNHFNVFVSAKALARSGLPLAEVVSFASPPYRIFIVFFTRYVLQHPALYADIQMHNRHVAPVLRLFREEVDRLLGLIERGDRAGFADYVTQMQPYFAPNQGDSELSGHLIQQLGLYLSR